MYVKVADYFIGVLCRIYKEYFTNLCLHQIISLLIQKLGVHVLSVLTDTHPSL